MLIGPRRFFSTPKGIAWASDEKNGSVRSVTLEALIGLFTQNGIPIQFGNITKKMIEKCQELIVVGTGMRVAMISHIHTQKIEMEHIEC